MKATMGKRAAALCERCGIGQDRPRLRALVALVFAHPGLDIREYCAGGVVDETGRRAYMSDARSITADLQEFRAVLCLKAYRITEDIIQRMGDRERWEWNETAGEWEYTTGQYYPCEYRAQATRYILTASRLDD